MNRAPITEPAHMLANQRPNSDELKCNPFNPMTGATAGIADIKNENSKFRAITTWSRGVERTHRITAPTDGLGCSEQSSELFPGCFHRRSTSTTSRKQAAFAVK